MPAWNPETPPDLFLIKSMRYILEVSEGIDMYDKFCGGSFRDSGAGSDCGSCSQARIPYYIL